MTKTHEVSTNKLIVIVLSSILSTMVVTAFSLLRVANSDHFTVIALGQRVGTLEELVVPRSEWDQRNEFIVFRLDQIDRQLTDIHKLLKE